MHVIFPTDLVAWINDHPTTAWQGGKARSQARPNLLARQAVTLMARLLTCSSVAHPKNDAETHTGHVHLCRAIDQMRAARTTNVLRSLHVDGKLPETQNGYRRERRGPRKDDQAVW